MNISLGEYIKLEESGGFCLQISKREGKNIDFISSFPVILKENLNLINILQSTKNRKFYLSKF